MLKVKGYIFVEVIGVGVRVIYYVNYINSIYRVKSVDILFIDFICLSGDVIGLLVFEFVIDELVYKVNIDLLIFCLNNMLKVYFVNGS